MSTVSTPRRSEVWLVQFDPALGAEIRKLRPAVFVSVKGVGRLPLRIVVPITDWKPQFAVCSWVVWLPASAESGLIKNSAADTFQVKSLSISRFERKLGELTDDQMIEIADAIANNVGAP